MSARAYLARAESAECALNASSGGIFGILAEHFILSGGIVVGAALDADLKVRHKVVRALDELPSLFKSKYVRSDFCCVLDVVRLELSKGNRVLFCGTPCQVNVVKKKCANSSNLVTCDILCHGTPSPAHFESWIRDIECAEGKKIVGYDWRCKEHGWSPLETRIDFEDGSTWYSRQDPYMYAFLNDISIGDSCHACTFAKSKRQGDFTLGDAWGLTRYWRDGEENIGISLLLVNSSIAEDMFTDLKGLVCYEIPFSVAVASQPVLSGEARLPPASKDIFQREFLKSGSFYRAVCVVLECERKRLKKKRLFLNTKMLVLKVACLVPLFRSKARTLKKKLKTKRMYMDFVLSDKSGDKTWLSCHE